MKPPASPPRDLELDGPPALHLRVALAHVRQEPVARGWADVKPWNRLFFVLSARGKHGGEICDAFGRHRLPLTPGTILYMPPQAHVACTYAPGAVVAAFHVGAETGAAPEAFSGQRQFLRFEDGELTARMARLVDATGSARDLAIHGACLEVMGRVADALGIRLHRPVVSPELKPLVRMIRDHGAYGLKVEDLATRFSVHRTRLSKDFSKAMGVPLKTYLDRAVLERAQGMLGQTDMSIREIARRLAFPDEFFFSHFFKRRTGRSPTDWRDDYRRLP